MFDCLPIRHRQQSTSNIAQGVSSTFNCLTLTIDCKLVGFQIFLHVNTKLVGTRKNHGEKMQKTRQTFQKFAKTAEAQHQNTTFLLHLQHTKRRRTILSLQSFN